MNSPPTLPIFPTELHRLVALEIGGFFAARNEADTVLVVNSCARGTAVPESDLDMAVLVKESVTSSEAQSLEQEWVRHASTSRLLIRFRGDDERPVHLDVFDGRFVAAPWDDGGGPDAFEVEVGNRVAYAVPLGTPGAHFTSLQSQWLPYYPDSLRLERLAMAREACAHDLARIPPLVRRGQSFSALAYLNKAFQEFLQALFIARRRYPLSYSKWIREQVTETLALPELYPKLPPILAVQDLESDEVEHRSLALRELLDTWTREV